MKYTSNYSLRKPDITDIVDINDFNTNVDKIDAEIKKVNDSLTNNVSNLTSQLEQIEMNKAGIDYVDNKINKVVGGTPKGVYPNITALEEAFPTGVEGIYITDDDKYWNYYDGERWVKGGIYQGNGISEDSVKDIHCKSMLTETNSLNSISNLLENSKKPTIGGKLNLNVKLENGILTCTKDINKTFGFIAFSLSNNLIFNATSKTKWLMYYEESLNVHCIGLNGVDLGKKIIVDMNNFNVTSNGQINFDEVLEGDLISITFASKLEVYKVINGVRKMLFELDSPNRIGFLVGGADGEIAKNLRDGNLKNELILSNVLTGFKNENLVLDRIGLLTDLTLPTATSSDLEYSYSYDGLNVTNILNEKTFGTFAFDNNNEIMFTATDSTKFIIYKEDDVNCYFVELTGVNKGNLISLNKNDNSISVVGKTTIENDFTSGDLLMFIKYQNTFYLLNRTKSNVIFRLYDFNKFGFVVAGYRGYIAKSIREFKSTYLVSDILLKSISNSEYGEYKGKNIACFGDSITWYDTQVPDPNWTTIKDYTPIKGYVSYIRDILGANTINEGISGQTTEEICARIREYDFSDCVATTITSGTNDFLHNKPLGELKPIGSEYDTTTFYGAYQSALEYIIKNYPKVKIYLATHIRGWKNVNNGIIASDRTYVDALIKIAELYGLPIVDWNKITRINEANKTYFSIDNVEHEPVNYYFHPSDEFHKYMGETLVSLIKNN